MKASVLAAFPSFSTKFEGRLPYMYTDVKGLVTTGIGNLIDPLPSALVLPWKHADGSGASRDEITSEWQTIKNAWPGIQSAATRSIVTLHLDPSDIDWLVAEKAKANEAYLRSRFPDFDYWPADAQLALHSMAWAMGPAFKFPKFEAAAQKQEFATAAIESHMNAAGNAGLVPRNAANVILFNNAEAVVRAGGDREVLYYPNSVTASQIPPAGGSKAKQIAMIALLVTAAGAGAYLFMRTRA